MSNKDLVNIFKLMLLTRNLDAKILSIQRQGRIGPYVPCAGEEAAMVASAYALNKQDWMVTSYRELGAHLTRGSSVDLILAQLFGNSNDELKGRQMSNSWGNRAMNILPTAAPIGAYLPVAVGIGLAARIRKEPLAVLTYLGDGATSSSDFHNAMNFAGVNSSPVVIFSRNTGWAISLPVSNQTRTKSLAVKSESYGFEGIQIDGNDAEKELTETRKALEKARSGGGPTFIEALTYRIAPHSTADDPTRYMNWKEYEKWKERDPLDILRKRLASEGLWSESQEKELVKEYTSQISSSVQRQESAKTVPPEELIFSDVYAEMPWNLEEQRADFLNG